MRDVAAAPKPALDVRPYVAAVPSRVRASCTSEVSAMSHKHMICVLFLLPLFVVAAVCQYKKTRTEKQIREYLVRAKQRVAELEKELGEVVPRGTHTMRAKIYVAGPYTKGDVAINVRNAFEA